MPASRRSLTYLFIGAAVIIIAALLYRNLPSESAKDQPAGTLYLALANTARGSSDTANSISTNPSQATEVQGDAQTVIWYDKNGDRYSTTVASGDEISREFAANNFYNFKIDSGSGSNFLLSVILPNLILFVLMALILLWIFRQTQSGNNQALSFGRSRARLLAGDKPAITFNDVAGVDEAKQELGEIVEFLKYPDKFAAVGARIPKGVLLVGPPGTGKTLLSKAVAGEAGVPFFSISGSEFVEMFVGVGASRVRDLFDQAKKNSPCIVFVDEIDASVDLEVLGKQTPGFSGADLSNLINEAAILAARNNRKLITMNDMEESIARVIAGPERRSRMISEKEKATIAFHEVGHALVGKTLEHTDPVHKITIVSRGAALGWTMSLPTEDRYLVSKAELIDQLAQILGGRCSEELIFGEHNITTGASDDIRKATQLARKMVTEWGMSDKLGPLTFGERQEMVFLGRDFGEQRNYSEDVAGEIDQEVHQLVADAFLRAKQVLRERQHVLEA